MRLMLLHLASLAGSCRRSERPTMGAWSSWTSGSPTARRRVTGPTSLRGETPMVLDCELFLRAAGRLAI
jgi:hypothetical protein